MCRLVAYAGHDPLPLSAAFFDAPHALQHQSYLPKLMLQGHVNVDGAGAAWWVERGQTPARYVTPGSVWADPNLFGLAKRTTAPLFLAAVRSATPGIPHGPAHVQPFVSGAVAGIHNGWIGGFRGPIGQQLIASLPEESFAELTAMNDSQVLFLHAGAKWREHGNLATAVRAALEHIESVLAPYGEAATLNLVLSDGETVVAARHSRSFECNSLFWSQRPGGNWLASEPFEDGGEWDEIAPHSLVTMTADTVDIEAI